MRGKETASISSLTIVTSAETSSAPRPVFSKFGRKKPNIMVLNIIFFQIFDNRHNLAELTGHYSYRELKTRLEVQSRVLVVVYLKKPDVFGLRHCAFYDVFWLVTFMPFDGICQTLGVSDDLIQQAILQQAAASSRCRTAKNSGRFDAGFA